MTFQVGEKVVYPNHGVGTVENISSRNFGTQLERFYLLRLFPNSLTVMVPFSHVGDVGLRKVTKASDITRVLTYLSSGIPIYAADWKDRFKDNTEKMTSGSLIEIAEVFKGLVIIQMGKPLSFREKKMLERARSMLVLETSMARTLTEPDAVTILARALGKCNLPMPLAL